MSETITAVMHRSDIGDFVKTTENTLNNSGGKITNINITPLPTLSPLKYDTAIFSQNVWNHPKETFTDLYDSARNMFSSSSIESLLEGTSFKGSKPPTSANFKERAREQIPEISYETLQLIKVFEGFSDKAYSGAGACDATIGFGSSELSGKPEVKAALERGFITIREAEDLMISEVKSVLPLVKNHFPDNLNPNQLGVLISLAYNGGEQALIDLKKKCGGDISKIPSTLPDFYVTSDGQYLEGLVTRRGIETKLWNTSYTA